MDAGREAPEPVGTLGSPGSWAGLAPEEGPSYGYVAGDGKRPPERLFRPMINRTKVLIVDGHRMAADGLERLLSPADWIHVIGKAQTLREAETLGRLHDPNVVLFDLQLPDSQGADTVLAIRRCCPEARLIALTAYDWGAESVPGRLGVAAFLRKEVTTETIVEAISSVTAPVSERESGPKLTDREIEVARLAAKGLSNQQIAEILNISQNTIKTHVAHVLRKLSLKRRVDLARQWGN